LTDPSTIEVDEEKARSWLEKGALPSDSVARILEIVGVLEKKTKRPVKKEG
jgi:small subunit ribosomal protein S16